MDTWPRQLFYFSPGRCTANEETQCECHDPLHGCIPLFCHWPSPDSIKIIMFISASVVLKENRNIKKEVTDGL